MVYITVDGEKYEIDFYERIEGPEMKVGYFIYSKKYGWLGYHKTKIYYRHERTWDDHMGNTPCGYYTNVMFKGKKRRVYIYN